MCVCVYVFDILCSFDLLGAADVHMRPFFSLDFNDSPTPSQMDIGGVQERYRDNIRWSPIKISLNYHWFELHSMSVCGVDVMSFEGSVAPPFASFVDTGASCLQLPAEMFDALVSWLPVICEAQDGFDPYSFSSYGTSSVCYVDADLVADGLPTISFTVSADGAPLYLPLKSLLLAEADGKQRLCITRGYSFYLSRSISFGTRAVSAFYAAFDMGSDQVGFANKAAHAASHAMCREREECRGSQTTNPAQNQCLDPDCYYFPLLRLEESSMTCRLTPSFYWFASVMLVLFVVIEVGLNEAHVYYTQLALKTIRPTLKLD